MKKYIIIPVIAIILLQTSCKKALDSLINVPTPPPPTAEVAHTAIGTPIGNAVTKSIGADGGSIVSEDGKVELTFPAGALTANTDISIQPVTNEAPGGIGTSYHFMPDGSKFNQPVTLTFHYTDEDIQGTIPYLLYIAYQDSTNAWKADFVKRNVDTVAKTVSLGIGHFSIWSMGSRLKLSATPKELHESETSNLEVFYSSPGHVVPDPGHEDLVTLVDNTYLDDNAINNWKVNGGPGNSIDGTISGTGNNVTYIAPSQIDEVKTVQVSAEVNYSIVYYNNGGQVASVNKLILFKNITLLPSELDFTVNIDYQENPVQGVTYEDKATFDLSINLQKDNDGSLVIILAGSNYKNNAPVVTPATKTYSDGSSFTCIPGPHGLTDVQDVTLLSFTEDSAKIRLVHGTVENWGVHEVNALGQAADNPVVSLPSLLGVPKDFTIALKHEAQTKTDGLGGSLQLIPK